ETAARELYRRPALRRAVISRAPSILPDARRDLLAGALDLETALTLFNKLPDEEQTDQEWAALRRLRDRALANPEDTSAFTPIVLQSLIRDGDEWEATDLAYARIVAERALTVTGEAGCLGFLIGVLERK